MQNSVLKRGTLMVCQVPISCFDSITKLVESLHATTVPL